MVTNYRDIDAPRSAERGVLMTSHLSAGNVQVTGVGGRSFRSRYIYIYNLSSPDAPCIRAYSRNMDDSKFESCERQDALTCLYK